jgi:hypothetical protein
MREKPARKPPVRAAAANEKRAPKGRVGCSASRAARAPAFGAKGRSAQQRQHELRQLVGLRDHRVPACCRICERDRLAVSAAKSASMIRERAAAWFSDTCRLAMTLSKRFCTAP